MLTTEEPIAALCSVSDGVRKSTQDLLAYRPRQARVDDAAGLPFVEPPGHVCSNRRIARVRPLRSFDPETNAIAQRCEALARPPTRFLQRHLSHAAQAA
jgi:hypothetical protein